MLGLLLFGTILLLGVGFLFFNRHFGDELAQQYEQKKKEGNTYNDRIKDRTTFRF